MRHQKSGRKLGRPVKERMALLTNLSISVLLYEKVKTTEPKAKEVRPIVEKLITKAKKNTVAARRELLASLHNNETAVKKLMEVCSTRYAKRDSGFVRIVKLDNRKGDNAPMALISLLPE
ncbi:MAG TPA: 50S ribosomal protein L17 [bacterium]|nr:50S ribosomal protein L17 [bacterium]